MSLKAFHVFFVLLAAAMSGFCALWAGREYRLEPSGAMMLFAVLSAACGAGIVAYGAWFLRKSRHLSYI